MFPAVCYLLMLICLYCMCSIYVYITQCRIQIRYYYRTACYINIVTQVNLIQDLLFVDKFNFVPSCTDDEGCAIYKRFSYTERTDTVGIAKYANKIPFCRIQAEWNRIPVRISLVSHATRYFRRPASLGNVVCSPTASTISVEYLQANLSYLVMTCRCYYYSIRQRNDLTMTDSLI